MGYIQVFTNVSTALSQLLSYRFPFGLVIVSTPDNDLSIKSRKSFKTVMFLAIYNA